MSNRRYPQYGVPEYSSRQSRSGCTHCDLCKHEFSPVETFAVVEVKTNWFRGDDEVWTCCASCCIKERIAAPPPLKLEKMQCRICGSKHRTQQGLNDHTKSKHGPEALAKLLAEAPQ